MTQSLPPEMQVSIVFGDIMMDVNDDETGVGNVEIEGKKYSVFAITPKMKENG